MRSRFLFSGLRARSSCVPARLRIVPASILLDKLVCLGRTPRLRGILVDGRLVCKKRVYDPPLRLDGVLAHEERLVTLHSAFQEALVGRHLVGKLVDRD